jgi:hypothetical protein
MDRIRGDHRIYTRPGSGSISIPMWREVTLFIIQGNMRTAGMSRQRYLELLASV